MMSAPRNVRRRGDDARAEIAVLVETTTPVLGGAAATRQIDEADFIRVPSIRGHLRLWWRALHGGSFATFAALAEAEARLWGKAADEKGGRSAIEVAVATSGRGKLDNEDINANAAEGYALWPARGTASGEAPAPRRQPPVRFVLTVSMPAADEATVRDVVRAWLLFGGYGSRTRRGVGSLTVTDRDQAIRTWLPADAYSDEWHELDEGGREGELGELQRALRGWGWFKARQAPALPFPVLAGATLIVGRLHRQTKRPTAPAIEAWREAIGWLQKFRQGECVGRDAGRGTPGRSRWPEADKLRHLTGRQGHPPRYRDRGPVWPRAGFGLPIVGRFKDPGEPEPFELTWQALPGDVHDRMASPLIVKPLATQQGFRPAVLWLHRASPGGKVVARRIGPTKTVIPGSEAAFGYLGSATDSADYRNLRAPLAGHQSVRQAFLDWVCANGGVKVM